MKNTKEQKEFSKVEKKQTPNVDRVIQKYPKIYDKAIKIINRILEDDYTNVEKIECKFIDDKIKYLYFMIKLSSDYSVDYSTLRLLNKNNLCVLYVNKDLEIHGTIDVVEVFLNE